jgi:hypothetical protein
MTREEALAQAREAVNAGFRKTPAGYLSSEFIVGRVADAIMRAWSDGRNPTEEDMKNRPDKRWDLCPFPLHADDCNCHGIGGDR